MRITYDDIRNKLLPLEVGTMLYLEFNIKDFANEARKMGQESHMDSAYWAYENIVVKRHANRTAREAAQFVLLGYGLPQKAVQDLTEKECDFLKAEMFDPLMDWNKAEISYGTVLRNEEDAGLRFIKVLKK